MAKWNFTAQVIDLGVIEMGSDFVTYNGVKVAMPDGSKRFLGKVMMHNEVHSVFAETQGTFVNLYLSGRSGKDPALLYGMKTENEDVFRKETPFSPAKASLVLAGLLSLPFCLLLIGFPMVAACWLLFLHFRRWDPPSRRAFEAHHPAGPVAWMPPMALSAGRS